MAQFTVPSQSSKYSTVVEAFRGVDLNNSPSNVGKSRSPEAPNMIRDQVGKVRKRTGYTTKVTASGGAAINGVHRLGDVLFIHAGTKLYRRLIGTDGAAGALCAGGGPVAGGGTLPDPGAVLLCKRGAGTGDVPL